MVSLKKNKLIWLAVIFLVALLTGANAANRGIRVVAKTPRGQTIPLYSRSYALVVGNADYKKGWDPLPGAARDVIEVARTLEKNGFTVVLKQNLTRAGFNRALREFIINYGDTPDNQLLFYYAGHGHTRAMANGEMLGYLVMVDAPVPERNRLEFELCSVDMQSLVTQAKMIKSKHVLFMFDSCFSGSILSLRDRVVPQHISENMALPVRQFITAGRANEPVPDHSVFKQSFIDLLEGRAPEPIPDGYVTGEELGLFLKNNVPEYNPTQHPQYGKIRDINLDKGDFVFVLASSGAVVEAPAKPKTGHATSSPTDATVSVETGISGAAVFIDGKPVGTGNIRDLGVTAGSHRIRVEKPGYAPYERTITIASGRSASLYVDLSPAKVRNGRLYVDARPGDARIRILNIGPAFYQGMDLPAGNYHVEVSAIGYDTKTLWVGLASGEDKQLDIRLSKATATVSGVSPFGAPAGGAVEKTITNSLGMKFVYIPPGTFTMGSPEREPGRDKDEKQHQVTLTKGFYMQTTEVTQKQWAALMGKNPSHFKGSGNSPVENVTWKEVQTFIRKLSQRERAKGHQYSLPTEAQWEYACRAGTTTPFAFGNCLSTDQANYDGNYPQNGCAKGRNRKKTLPVQSLGANSWGLYDMHGNVWEWCMDKYADFAGGSVSDPTGPRTGKYQVIRGGSWNYFAKYGRSASRLNLSPDRGYDYVGFRLIKIP